jgi:hypothetical protein
MRAQTLLTLTICALAIACALAWLTLATAKAIAKHNVEIERIIGQ